MFPTLSKNDLPHLSTDDMIEVDRAAIEDYHLLLIQMMENAGRGLAHLARAWCGGDVRGKRILAMAGAGGNGGGALVAARRLANYGAEVHIALGQEPASMTEIPNHQREICTRMGLAGTKAAADTRLLGESFDVILDGLIGYSLRGEPQGLVKDIITGANRNPAPIIALDAPSGVDTASGRVSETVIRADATLTLALPKAGLFVAGVAEKTGRVFLADLSIPTILYSQPPLKLNVSSVFHGSDIVELI